MSAPLTGLPPIARSAARSAVVWMWATCAAPPAASPSVTRTTTPGRAPSPHSDSGCSQTRQGFAHSRAKWRAGRIRRRVAHVTAKVASDLKSPWGEALAGSGVRHEDGPLLEDVQRALLSPIDRREVKCGQARAGRTLYATAQQASAHQRGDPRTRGTAHEEKAASFEQLWGSFRLPLSAPRHHRATAPPPPRRSVRAFARTSASACAPRACHGRAPRTSTHRAARPDPGGSVPLESPTGLPDTMARFAVDNGQRLALDERVRARIWGGRDFGRREWAAPHCFYGSTTYDYYKLKTYFPRSLFPCIGWVCICFVLSGTTDRTESDGRGRALASLFPYPCSRPTLLNAPRRTQRGPWQGPTNQPQAAFHLGNLSCFGIRWAAYAPGVSACFGAQRNNPVPSPRRNPLSLNANKKYKLSTLVEVKIALARNLWFGHKGKIIQKMFGHTMHWELQYISLGSHNNAYKRGKLI